MSMDQLKPSTGASGHTPLPERRPPLSPTATAKNAQAPAAKPADRAASANTAAPPGADSVGRATADSVIQAMLTENNKMGDGKLPIEFSVDPMVLTESVAREMAQKLSLTIEESMLLQKMRATEVLTDQSRTQTAQSTAVNDNSPSNAYGDLTAKRP